MAKGPFDFHGFSVTDPINRLKSGVCSIAVNVRAYFAGGVTFRNLLTGAIYTLSAAVHSLKRLNDSTPNGPSSGYSIINGAGTVLSIWNSTIGVKNVATGLSGNPLSIVPFRPNTSVQPWGYIGDSAPQGNVTIATQYLVTTGPNANLPVNFVSNGMLKVRSDGRGYKSGIKEPQLAPTVSTENSSVTKTGTLQATTIPWSNYSGDNTDYDYGHTDAYIGQPGGISPFDGTAPFIVNCANASTITITALTGTATVNGASHGPSDSSAAWVVPANPGFPGQFIQVAGSGATPTTASVVLGCFTDGSGNVVAKGVAPIYRPSVVDVGAVISVPNAITVPSGAQTFQIGINSSENTFNSNYGSFVISVTVTTNALPSVTSTLGNMTLYYWGDSPHSGPVTAYIWKNPGDSGGSGPTRATSNADGNTTGNSFIFDATFVSGIPQLPGIGDYNLSMQWFNLNQESAAVGSNAVFAAPIPTTSDPNNTQYANFNFCLNGSIYFPASGNYTFVLTSKDDTIWGIGGGVKLVSASAIYKGSGSPGPIAVALSGYGQKITVVGGYPLLPRGNYPGGHTSSYTATTVVVNVPSAGIYPIEIDYDYWYSTDPGRILLLSASPLPGGSPTIIPPLPAGVKQEVQYRYVYRSSATGATSNPSPESVAETVPVTANTVTSVWSPDPQVDVVDYYRIDSTIAEFTYVATGPNDDVGSGTNTPINDALTDTELGSQLLQYDNYEPFPSIDLPQKGVCSVSGGVITWVSGGAIGGSSTGFNIRWLAGTEILIGSPTSLAYTFIARPTSNTTVAIPGVPDGDNLAYEIPQPILAAQPLPYMWGPTDNINFTYAVGDPLRPGTLYWCNGSNLDAAADTNSIDITDPGEPLVGGNISKGLGVVFSIRRAWLILPNFFNATATAQGVIGSTWTLQESSISRGLYMPRCVAIEGGGIIFFRVADGIHASDGGASSISITDDDLYPLFPHESSDSGTSVPQPVTRNGITIYPPDDSQPQSQRFSVVNQFLYYDYIGLVDGLPHTLVYDINNHGWILDTYTPAVTIHASNDGVSVQGVLAGCNDGTIREMANG